MSAHISQSDAAEDYHDHQIWEYFGSVEETVRQYKDPKVVRQALALVGQRGGAELAYPAYTTQKGSIDSVLRTQKHHLAKSHDT